MTYRTANLQSCILYIYSTNIGTKYFKHGILSVFFSSKCSLFHNSNIFGSCIIHILYTGCAKIKKKRRQNVNIDGGYISYLNVSTFGWSFKLLPVILQLFIISDLTHVVMYVMKQTQMALKILIIELLFFARK